MIFHKPTYAKIEYVEFTHTGQGFNLGRYSMHFHMSDRQPNSYFRGMGTHHTFNRAMTIHGTFDALFEWNVAYRCEGAVKFNLKTENRRIRIFSRPSRKKSPSQEFLLPWDFWKKSRIQIPENTGDFPIRESQI